MAEEDQLPICQDTGVACVFLEVGQEVHIQETWSKRSMQASTKAIWKQASGAPWWRTPAPGKHQGQHPAVLYIRLVPGDRLKITVAPKGAGSENMSRIAMLRPSDGAQGVKDFVVKTVAEAGPNPCPPIVVGVGIGGGFDRSAELAKRALLRPAGSPNPDPFYAEMEQELLERINALGIGPQGLGGRTTALAVHIEVAAVHMASLPVAVNINSPRDKTRIGGAAKWSTD
ncbi:MAG: fumarate hydratase [Oscillospiraceae bacterium]